ncbi:3-hydroxyisobutyrate dehydrogenase-like beta-hydroxyacid dehydrogenase [Streptomyces sp. SLBN-118]|uniref:NAD(P)-dependent oxidoreductase n=1 Tax=Streptomyces sp. SLBN-118 TaxID=2768454 RepID=UPI00114FC46C|nr:NAD(P)-dependent oxidoreductase [Streptomyces sp. SLBN-118]TQK42307.1 3-hydroxyisobutyrate dehydrogenase-like beta-hydroxyacid dehydrogenase [Streptomyces sp. SLBN-118]
MTTVTLLHPGSMGAPLAAQAVLSGHRVLWVAEGRSDLTRSRAEKAGLIPCSSLGEALAASEIVLSVCPPQAAESVAAAVATHEFEGTYVDANAISPQRMLRTAERMAPGCAILDGAIIGPPPGQGRRARLYLSGDPHVVGLIGELFENTEIDVRRAGAELGAASALKMAFASFQKVARTLAGVSHALAEQYGVAHLLTAEAKVMTSEILSDPGYLPSVAARAWRWAPEMGEVAEALRAAGLPPQMAEAAAAVMQLWEKDKDQNDLPLADVLAHLRRTDLGHQ